MSQIVKGERDKEEEETRRAQYLSANCVIFTYIPGEVSKLVDDHFNKVSSGPLSLVQMIEILCSHWLKS